MKTTNGFDERWQTLARRARTAADDRGMGLPFGFASRMVALWQAAPAEPWEDLFSTFSRRALMGLAAVCLITAGYAFFEWHEFRIERPQLELTVSSEFPWQS